MSLAARIAVGPSRRLGLLAAAVAVGGVIIVASTVVARWPAAASWASIGAVIASVVLAFAAARGNRRGRCQLTVSERTGIDVARGDDEPDGPWRLVAPTLAWPGFCVVALERDDVAGRAGSLRLGIFDFELAKADRRSLRRFLMWSLRGGAAVREAPERVRR